MSILVHKNPWDHAILNDFYEADSLNVAAQEILAFLKSASNLNQHMCYYNPDVQVHFPVTHNTVFSTKKVEDLVNLLSYFPKHRQYKSLTVEQTVNILLGDFEYPLHCDNERKILTAITYLYPTKSIGTQLYDTAKQYAKTVEWVPFSTFIFAPITDVTWHSYKTAQNKVRVTLNTCLIST